MREQTYWNGLPCSARRVRVVVGKAERDTYWYAGLEGTMRRAVEVISEGQTFYLDDDLRDDRKPGHGWEKVTVGRGSPQWGHSSLAVERLVPDPDEQRLRRALRPPPKREDYPSRQAFRRACRERSKTHRDSPDFD